jgi:hypothetical protein
MKLPSKRDKYNIIKKGGIAEFASKYAITSKVCESVEERER